MKKLSTNQKIKIFVPIIVAIIGLIGYLVSPSDDGTVTQTTSDSPGSMQVINGDIYSVHSDKTLIMSEPLPIFYIIGTSSSILEQSGKYFNKLDIQIRNSPPDLFPTITLPSDLNAEEISPVTKTGGSFSIEDETGDTYSSKYFTMSFVTSNPVDFDKLKPIVMFNLK